MIAAFVASAASDLLSTLISSIFFPSIPPSALISSIAKSIASASDEPYDATAPESSRLAPILIVSPPSELLCLHLPTPNNLLEYPIKSDVARKSDANFDFFI